MSNENLQRLAAILPLPDAAFDDYWASYLKARPKLVPGSTLEIEREQLRQLFKLAFSAGRLATIDSLGGVS